MQLVVGRRRELAGFMSAVGTPLSMPDQIDIMISPAMRAAAEDVALRRADEQRDADLAPVIGDEFEHVGLQRAFAGRLDDDLRRASVGQQPHAVVVTRSASPASSSSALAWSGSWAIQAFANSGRKSGLSGRTVSALSCASP